MLRLALWSGLAVPSVEQKAGCGGPEPTKPHEPKKLRTATSPTHTHTHIDRSLATERHEIESEARSDVRGEFGAQGIGLRRTRHRLQTSAPEATNFNQIRSLHGHRAPPRSPSTKHLQESIRASLIWLILASNNVLLLRSTHKTAWHAARVCRHRPEHSGKMRPISRIVCITGPNSQILGRLRAKWHRAHSVWIRANLGPNRANSNSD